jgi:hypothetical protein
MALTTASSAGEKLTGLIPAYLKKRLIRSVTLKRHAYTLPWPQHPGKITHEEPVWNKMVGRFVIKSIVKAFGSKFSVGEFLDGVKYAVSSVAEMMQDKDRHEDLSKVMSTELYKEVKEVLDSLPPLCHIHLDIESLRQLETMSFSCIAGEASPGDEHVIAGLGQMIVTSQSRMQDFSKDLKSFTTKDAREIALEAGMSRLEFQLGVGFKTKEKFAVIEDESGSLLMGSNKFVDCSHYWVFSSLVERNTSSDYPLNWIIVDINNYFNKQRIPTE